MKKILTVIVLLAFATTGCTGSFKLTKKVYNFHRSQEDKWSDELCFLLVALTPIYGLATFADALIFNSIEFWSGENPIASNNTHDTQLKVVREGKDEVLVAYDTKTDQVILTPKMQNKKTPSLVLERKDGMVLAKNTQGELLFSSVKNDQGDLSIYDGNGKLIKNYSAQEIELIKENSLRN